MLPPNILTILKEHLTGSQWQSAAELFKNHSDLIRFLIEKNEWEVIKTCFTYCSSDTINVNAIITIDNISCSVLWHISRCTPNITTFQQALQHFSKPNFNIKPSSGIYRALTPFNFLAAFKEWDVIKELMIKYPDLNLSSIQIDETTKNISIPLFYMALEQEHYDVLKVMLLHHPKEFYRSLGYFTFTNDSLLRTILEKLRANNIKVDLNFIPYGEDIYHNNISTLFFVEDESLLAGASIVTLVALRLVKGKEEWQPESLLMLQDIFSHHQPIDINLTLSGPGNLNNYSIFKILSRKDHWPTLSYHFINSNNPQNCIKTIFSDPDNLFHLKELHLPTKIETDETLMKVLENTCCEAVVTDDGWKLSLTANEERNKYYNTAVQLIEELALSKTEHSKDYFIDNIIKNLDAAIELKHPFAQLHAVMLYRELFYFYMANRRIEEAYELIVARMESIYLAFLGDLLFDLGNFCYTQEQSKPCILAIVFLSEAILFDTENETVFHNCNLLLLHAMAYELKMSLHPQQDFNLIKAHQNFLKLMEDVIAKKNELFGPPKITITKELKNQITSSLNSKGLCNTISVKNADSLYYQLINSKIAFFVKITKPQLNKFKTTLTPIKAPITFTPS